MDYQNYEDYMRSVLGYNTGNIYANTYNPRNDFYYDMSNMDADYIMPEENDYSDLYPEIYKLMYPMVCKVCTDNSYREITKDLLEKMTDEIYLNFEAEDRQPQNMRTPLKNGDVRNPNAKEPETRQETRQGNYLLRDLIRILILREMSRRRRPNRPPFPPPGRPPMPRPRPPMGPGNQSPWRPY